MEEVKDTCEMSVERRERERERERERKREKERGDERTWGQKVMNQNDPVSE